MKLMRKDPADFVQITRGYLRELRELAKRSPAAHQVLWLLTERMNKTNAVVMTHKTMGQRVFPRHDLPGCGTSGG